MQLRKMFVAMLAQGFGHIDKTDTALMFYRNRWLPDHSFFTRAEPMVCVCHRLQKHGLADLHTVTPGLGGSAP